MNWRTPTLGAAVSTFVKERVGVCGRCALRVTRSLLSLLGGRAPARKGPNEPCLEVLPLKDLSGSEAFTSVLCHWNPSLCPGTDYAFI